MLNVEDLLNEVMLAQRQAYGHLVSHDVRVAFLLVLERPLPKRLVLVELQYAVFELIVKVDAHFTDEDHKHLGADITFLHNDLAFVIHALVKLVADVAEDTAFVVGEERHVELEVLPKEEVFIRRPIVHLCLENLLH